MDIQLPLVRLRSAYKLECCASEMPSTTRLSTVPAGLQLPLQLPCPACSSFCMTMTIDLQTHIWRWLASARQASTPFMLPLCTKPQQQAIEKLPGRLSSLAQLGCVLGCDCLHSCLDLHAQLLYLFKVARASSCLHALPTISCLLGAGTPLQQFLRLHWTPGQSAKR